MRVIQTALFETVERKSHHPTYLSDENVRCNQVLVQLRKNRHGASAEELAVQLGLRVSQVGPALSDLHDWGFVRKTESQRRTSTGGYAVIWVAA